MTTNKIGYAMQVMAKQPIDDREHIQEQHDRVLNAIFDTAGAVEKRVAALISLDTYALLKERSYQTAAAEALIIANYSNAHDLLAPIKKVLRAGDYLEVWYLYPPTIIGIMRGSMWCSTHEQYNHEFEQSLPSFVGQLLYRYVSQAVDGCKCSDWERGQFSQTLAAYLSPQYMGDSLRRAKAIVGELDKLPDTIHESVGSLVNEATHRVMTLIQLRDQISMLHRHLHKETPEGSD